MALKVVRLGLLSVLCCLACSRKVEPPRRTEPWLANPSASADTNDSSAPLAFHLTPDSRIRFSVPGRKAKVSGQLPVGEGALRLDPRDLQSASASIEVDLRQLSIDEDTLPESVELGGATPSALALQWLELGPDVSPERRNELAKARFELTAVENLSQSMLDFATARQNARVRATAVGTLLIHGFRAPVRVEVVLTPLKRDTSSVQRLSIRSASPLVIALAPHDISARSPSGIADTLGMARAADWVGKNARIEFELVAEAEQPAAK